MKTTLTVWKTAKDSMVNGLRLTYDATHGEYGVHTADCKRGHDNYAACMQGHKGCYYTTDLNDAIDTGKAMGAKSNG